MFRGFTGISRGGTGQVGRSRRGASPAGCDSIIKRIRRQGKAAADFPHSRGKCAMTLKNGLDGIHSLKCLERVNPTYS
jgi:hypothetical protein